MMQDMRQVHKLEDYKRNQEVYQQYIKERTAILNQLKQEINTLENSLTEFIDLIDIDETVKGFASIDSGQRASEFGSLFDGAKFGTTVQDQVDILSEMVNSGGINFADADWLILALMNTGKGLIGRKNLPLLQTYLSGFASFLMFTDASNIVDNIVQYMDQSAGKQSKLHLYYLNTQYVPLSYILSQTKQRMMEFYNKSQNYLTSGTNIEITNSYSADNTLPYFHDISAQEAQAQWIQEGEEALSSVHMRMTFLAGFLDLLEDLRQSLPSLG